MSMERVHSLGDSWTCIEAGGANAGWQVYAGLFPEHRHGIPGSTAAQWAVDEGGILTAATGTMRPGDTVFVSLVGNDFRHAIADGVLTQDEVVDACDSLRQVILRLRASGAHVIVMGYANPYCGNEVAQAAANALCMMIRRVANESGAKYFDVARHLVMPEHFDGKDFHPTAAGHRAIARAVEQEVNG
jgi:lysophospholipase L1-like esterase